MASPNERSTTLSPWYRSLRTGKNDKIEPTPLVLVAADVFLVVCDRKQLNILDFVDNIMIKNLEISW
jgi:hypothetical protein